MNKIILLPIMIIAIIYFVIFQLVPSVKESLSLRTERDQKNEEIIKVKKNKENLEKFIKEADGYQKEIDFIGNFLPKDPNEDKIINTIYQKAKNNNISLFIVDSKDKLSQNSKNPVQTNMTEMNITFSGSYGDIKNFLSDIFHLNRAYSLSSLKIEKIVLNRSNKEVAPMDNLTVNATFNCSYVANDLSLSVNDVKDGLKSKYDFIDKIIKITTEVIDIEKVNSGRSNPFLPS